MWQVIVRTKKPSRAWKDKVNPWIEDAVQCREEALDERDEAMENFRKAEKAIRDEFKKRKGPAGKQEEQLRQKS